MTEFEFAEMIQGAVSNGLTSFTIWLTLVSGFLYVAYTAGKDLKRIQTIIISTLYLVSASIFTAMTFVFFSRAAATVDAKADVFPDAVLPVASSAVMQNTAIAIASLMALGVLVSLYFLLNVRGSGAGASQ